MNSGGALDFDGGSVTKQLHQSTSIGCRNNGTPGLFKSCHATTPTDPTLEETHPLLDCWEHMD